MDEKERQEIKKWKERYESMYNAKEAQIEQLRQELDELRKEYERLRKYATEIAAEGSAESERLHKKIKWLEANNKLLAEELE